MFTIRTRLFALAVACLVVPAFAQNKDAKPADTKPAAAPAAGEKKMDAKPAAKEEHKADTTAAASTGTAKIGSPAPDFKLKDLEGKDVSLAGYKGKIVVLEWSNSGCPVCQRHAKAKTAAHTMDAFKGKDVVWVNIDSTGDAKADDLKKFVKDNGLTAAYLMDPTGATGKAYGAKTTPHMFVIDTKGNLAYAGAIDDDNDGSKGEKAKNYVKEAVEALLKGSTVATSTTEPYGCKVHYKG
ncbi:MAG: redoxin domain-containing protein [Planctomycetes bacterium]|nr:redoxin domain-containing protein [Planctomycetota bacterium]MBI3834839.1 redoxin domain-containing protein [Planctomycetota bacterium]